MTKNKKLSVWADLPKMESRKLPMNIFEYLISLPNYISHVRMRKTDFFEQLKLVGNAHDHLVFKAGKAGWFFADDTPNSRVIFFRGEVYIRRFKQKADCNEQMDYIESVIFHTLYYFSLAYPPQ
jgi:hypothetical protein